MTSPVNGWVILANSRSLNTVLPITSYLSTLIRSVVGIGGFGGVAVGGVRGTGWMGKVLGIGWGNRSICGGAGRVVWAMAGMQFEPTNRERAKDIVGWVMKVFNLLPVGN